jgi:hypothetical protein
VYVYVNEAGIDCEAVEFKFFCVRRVNFLLRGKDARDAPVLDEKIRGFGNAFGEHESRAA